MAATDDTTDAANNITDAPETDVNEVEVRDEFTVYVVSDRTQQRWGGIFPTYDDAHAAGVTAAYAMVTLGASKVSVRVEKHTWVVNPSLEPDTPYTVTPHG